MKKGFRQMNEMVTSYRSSIYNGSFNCWRQRAIFDGVCGFQARLIPSALGWGRWRGPGVGCLCGNVTLLGGGVERLLSRRELEVGCLCGSVTSCSVGVRHDDDGL